MAAPNPKRRRRRIILLTLFLAYVGVMTFGGCADKFLLRPPGGQFDAGRAKVRDIQWGDRNIQVGPARPPRPADGDEPQAYVLEFCGNATRAEQIAQFVADRWKKYPIEAWVMNYPG